MIRLFIESLDSFKMWINSETNQRCDAHRRNSSLETCVKANIFSAKLSKTDILCFFYKKTHINYLFTELLYKITFKLVIFVTKRHSCDIALAAHMVSLII